MKKFLVALLKAIVILAVAVILGMIGISLDQQLWADRPEGVLGHGIPVYTFVLPMLWLSLLFWISVIKFVIRLLKKIFKKKDK